MNLEIPRLRMFAGPNGSGKSTIKDVINQELLGIYINPDEIEKEIKNYGFMNFYNYGFEADKNEVLDFFHNSNLFGVKVDMKVDIAPKWVHEYLLDKK